MTSATFQLSKPGSSQESHQPRKRGLDVAVIARQPALQIALLVGSARRADRGQAAGFGEEMRRHQHEAAHPEILDGAGVDRRDRRAVAVPDKHAARKTDGVENSWQHVDASRVI